MPETKRKYDDVCYRYITLQTADAVSAAANQRTMFERLRAERLKFIREQFSPAVNSIIDIALGAQLKKINRNNQTYINRILSRQLKCMNIICDGQLDEKHECVKCYTRFCKACDKSMMSDGKQHTCNQNDLESVRFVADLVKCPECRSPVVRSFGCNAITCAVCRVNFDYVTGNKCIHGNHTSDGALNMKTTPETLVQIYGGTYPTYTDMLSRIDAAKPAEYQFTRVTSLLIAASSSAAASDSDRVPLESVKHKIAIRYGKFIKFQQASKAYHTHVRQLDEWHRENVLNEQCLKTLVQSIESIGL